MRDALTFVGLNEVVEIGPSFDDIRVTPPPEQEENFASGKSSKKARREEQGRK